MSVTVSHNTGSQGCCQWPGHTRPTFLKGHQTEPTGHHQQCTKDQVGDSQ
jgi:hypothetical protein